MKATPGFRFCRIFPGALGVLMLYSCASQPTTFASMSQAEVLAYNRDKPVMQQIHCEHNKRSTGSHIRRTECKTVEDWVFHNTRTQMAIDTISTHRHSY